jgi:hypothetical protein
MQLTLIVNSVVCLVGTLVGLLFAGGSIISIANMTVPWARLLLVAALLIPVAFLGSGVGAWLAYRWSGTELAWTLIALPWLYVAAFVAAMLLSFRQ